MVKPKKPRMLPGWRIQENIAVCESCVNLFDYLNTKERGAWLTPRPFVIRWSQRIGFAAYFLCVKVQGELVGMGPQLSDCNPNVSRSDSDEALSPSYQEAIFSIREPAVISHR